MAINLNIDFNSLFKKRKATAHSSDALIPATKKVWRFSIMFLAIFAILIVAYDGYIFWEYVYNQQDVDIGGQGTVEGINRALFDNVSKSIDERASKFREARGAEVFKNPFHTSK
ncbi:MAG: hypothetical protein AAB367_01580 [Patescibacteria group bacterium]